MMILGPWSSKTPLINSDNIWKGGNLKRTAFYALQATIMKWIVAAMATEIKGRKHDKTHKWSMTYETRHAFLPQQLRVCDGVGDTRTGHLAGEIKALACQSAIHHCHLPLPVASLTVFLQLNIRPPCWGTCISITYCEISIQYFFFNSMIKKLLNFDIQIWWSCWNTIPLSSNFVQLV